MAIPDPDGTAIPPSPPTNWYPQRRADGSQWLVTASELLKDLKGFSIQPGQTEWIDRSRSVQIAVTGAESASGIGSVGIEVSAIASATGQQAASALGDAVAQIIQDAEAIASGHEVQTVAGDVTVFGDAPYSTIVMAFNVIDAAATGEVATGTGGDATTSVDESANATGTAATSSGGDSTAVVYDYPSSTVVVVLL